MKIGIIGGGAMGGAFAIGLLNSKDFSAKDIAVSDPCYNKLSALQSLDIILCDNNKHVAEFSDIIILAVKPWIVADVIEQLKNVPGIENKEVSIIAAGVSSEKIKELFGDKLPQNISIVIPNTAMRVGESMTFIVPVVGKVDQTKRLFEYTGMVKTIEERLLPAATALASCGIAFAMRYVRAACEGGVELGINSKDGLEIVTQTLIGTTQLLRQPGSHPETEIDKVTTPGGITIKGLNRMEKEGFTNAVIEGLKATCL